ncbi:MAG TPA: 50S ribosomal protein L15e [Candidatus Nanoarchaeia archaeon]|nr:50S ribosomal protein L15e [Candidatus Nanoarchaeia archaeon]
MGYQKYIRNLWKQPKQNLGDLWKQRLMQFRGEKGTIRIEHATRIDRAHALGFRAKPGFLIVRQRVARSKRMRPGPLGGRRPKHSRRRMVVSKNYQQIAEVRAADHFPNCEVLGSYWVAEDGKYAWYEIIFVDPQHPAIQADPKIRWIAEKQHTGRVYRGLTSASRKSRGLRRRGIGAEKVRPSSRSHHRRVH